MARSEKRFNKITNVLLFGLGIRIVFDSLFTIYTFVRTTSYFLYELLRMIDLTNVLSILLYQITIRIYELWDILESTSDWINFITGLLIILWLYFLHAVLKATLPNYPISPREALARFIIPIYNLWGLWNIFITLANQIKIWGKNFYKQEQTLRKCLYWLYIGIVFSSVTDSIYRVLRSDLDDRQIPFGLYFAFNVSQLIVSLTYWRIVSLVRQVLTDRTKLTNRESLDPVLPEEEAN